MINKRIICKKNFFLTNRHLKLYLNVLKTSTTSIKKNDFLLREFKSLLSTEMNNFQGFLKNLLIDN